MVCCPAASSSKARWESAVQSTRHESMNLFNKQTFRVLLLFLLASRSGCFVIYGGAGKNAVITGHRRPRSEIRSSSSRPLRRHLQHRFVSENARVGTRTRAKSLAVDSPGDGSSRWGRDSLRSLRSRQGIRIHATREEIEIEAETKWDGEEAEGALIQEGIEEDKKEDNKEADDEDNDEGGGEDGPYVPESEWHAITGGHDWFGDLPPIREYDPLDVPDDARHPAETLRGKVSCDSNPFSLSSFWVDREIEMGNVDEKMKAAIQPMMKTIEQVCELIDTTDETFSFKYTGLIQHRRGIEAWTKMLIAQYYPDVKGVKLVTNRTRDRRDH